MQTSERIEAIDWYHTLELGDGVETDGWFDLRPYVHHYGLPEDMTGMRVLEVGTWDGFWAFEMEKRGADVVALDLDEERDLDFPPRRRPQVFPEEPRGQGFRLAADITGSKVQRVSLSVYDALPGDLGQFDLVFCGSVLIHLRDQLLALERIANLCRGTFICAEEYDRLASLLPFAVSRYRADREAAVVFWLPSVRTWKRMVWTAGFDDISVRGRFVMRPASDRAPKKFKVPHIVLHARKSA